MTNHNQAPLRIDCSKGGIPGFINFDALPYPHVDPTYSCDILEHYSRRELGDALREWRRA